MEFGVLGPLEVRGRGRVLPLGAAKQRCLLGVLLLRPNEADRGGGGKPDDPVSCGAKRPCRAGHRLVAAGDDAADEGRSGPRRRRPLAG
jgi:hypothetical protein